MRVTHIKPVFIGSSLVPAGTPFEVVDGSKLESGMKEVDAEPSKKSAPKASKDAKGTDTKTAIGVDEPDTLAAMTKATVSADQKADPAQG